MALEISSTLSDDLHTLHLALNGQLDAATAPALESYVEEHLGGDISTLVLNLRGLSFVSSAGLRVFAKTRKLVKARNGRLCYVNLSPQVRKVFDIVKATPLSDVFASEEELDDYLKAMQDQVSAG